MGIISWIIFGAVVGIIANVLDPQPAKGGLLGAIVLGVIGAMVGGFLSSLFLGIDVTGFNLPSFAIAVGGSLLLLFIGRALARY
ncbi:GlsB/YeaQ/YmgE family stress response membrane protein [Candidatus Microgenomates bacterium]|nr:GlsB/YeaQ/YmgE family stress response membrane protein [Candidatus Microgenomates bacterium]